MKVRGVLFDLDGPLLDHEGAVADALDRWLPELGVTPGPDVTARWREITEHHIAAWAGAAFRVACARWGLPPESVLSVGDRHDLDVIPARAAGLSAVLIDRYGTGPADEPHRITTLRDLPL